MKKLIALICRHGETKLNATNCFRSWIDAPLDENGQKQAKDMADFLADYPVKRVIASPLIRTMVTAHEFADRLGIKVEQDRGLLPWNLGVLAGRSKLESTPTLQLFVDNPDIKIPAGESLNEFKSRVATFFTPELIASEDLPLTAFFCHTSNITMLESIINDEQRGPEDAEVVKPGGICGIYKTDVWLKIEPIFGMPEQANFGS
jgi:broad specificity phosphatase PhoE